MHSVAVFYAPTFLLLLGTYVYMYFRMDYILEEKRKGYYTPQMLISLVELLVFALIYTACAMLASETETKTSTTIATAIIAMGLSLLVFNNVVFEKLGRYTVVLATSVMLIYYVIARTIISTL
ncbi:hypothetical protein [Lysinibacillus xylanilyticus]|uniref:hypothetical protein n=1 Tax=Lysinibacillus xylanilyticus TaxID=582475 RepID=UPI0036D9A0E3